MFTTVCVGNCIGIVLLLSITVTNKNHLQQTRRMRYLTQGIIISMLSCIADIVAFAVDGRPGLWVTVTIYLTNSWLFLAVILIAYCWLLMVCELTGRKPSGVKRMFFMGLAVLGMIVLIVNLFYPLIFSVENNVYERQSFYFLFVLIGAVNILYGVHLIGKAKRRGEFILPFQIWIFIVPIILGIAIQSICYGISVIWVAIAIAISGMTSSIKNNLIYLDSLTGVLNHSYLKNMMKDLQGKHVKFTCLMADLNDFKGINDAHGHGEGDKALKTIVRIFAEAMGSYGRVIRCSGDEFIIVINSLEQEEVDGIIERIHKGCEEFNEKNHLDYDLSASIGQAVFDSSQQSFEEFLVVLDRNMYEKKREHYQNLKYDRRNR